MRNGGEALPLTLSRIARLQALCDHSQTIIVTNDNSDSTDTTLHTWEKNDCRNILIRADGLIQALPNRVDRIAAARNLYISYIQPLLRSSKWDFVIVIDLDGPNANLNIDWFEYVFPHLDISWSALFANQQLAYYDIYALRHPVWCPHDCLAEVHTALPRGVQRLPRIGPLLRRKAEERFIQLRQYRIPYSCPPIRVQSAFGGLAIYRADSVVNSWYGSRLRNGKNVCEHVIFNRTVEQRGRNLFIIPSLLNDAPPEHLGKFSGRAFDETLLNSDLV